jgi:NADH dehydrogenase
MGLHMSHPALHAVTGAYGYSGKYIARQLLEKGHKVITLTNSTDRLNPFGDSVKAYPFCFDDPDKLTETLRNVSVLYNTYWIRFNHKLFKHADAVENTKKLFKLAAKAGVKRIVHVSVTNPSKDSHLEYFSGKAVLEEALMETRISYAILRPTVIFGKEDILINNIAWLLRKMPVFGIFGDGKYRLQPIYVDDLAKIAVDAGEKEGNLVIDCLGPETFTYRELVSIIAKAIGKRKPVISIPPAMGYFAGKIISRFLDDIVITREEIDGLMSDLLYVDSEPTGRTKFSDWVTQNAAYLGKNYANELRRRKDRVGGYVQ